jgi:hypothetical protein
MKRLLDDPTDEVTRLLIQAAVDHQPPPSGKMRLVTALGMGSAVGLLSSEVFAWLSTAAGKATLGLAVVGVAAAGVAASGVYSTSVEHDVPQSHAAPRVTARPAPPPPPSLQLEAAAANDRTNGLDANEPLPIQPSAIDRPQDKLMPPPRARERERASQRGEPQRDQRRLGEETRWVDGMKVAAERGDGEALRRLLTGYVEKFPEGQLRPEVEKIKNAP